MLEAACIECLERERRRLGRFGAAYAWGRLIADTLIAAILLRPTSTAVAATRGVTCHRPLRRRS